MCTHKRGGSSGRLRLRRKSRVVRLVEILGWKFLTDAGLLLRLVAKGGPLPVSTLSSSSKTEMRTRGFARFENRQPADLNPLKDDNRDRHFRPETSPTSSTESPLSFFPFLCCWRDKSTRVLTGEYSPSLSLSSPSLSFGPFVFPPGLATASATSFPIIGRKADVLFSGPHRLAV